MSAESPKSETPKPALVSPPVVRCPGCRKKQPAISAETYGENDTSVMVVFVAHCCRTILGVQLLAKQPNMKKDEPLELPPV